MMKLFTTSTAIIISIVLLVLVFQNNPDESNPQKTAPNSKSPSTPEPEEVHLSPIDLRYKQIPEKLLNDPTDWSESAKLLAEPGHEEEEYIQAIQDILENYRYLVKSGSPTGLNVEITNALLGKNQKLWALLDQNHPKINGEGELVDQWQTPYHFHNLSLADTEIRSAGPDKKIYTEDDITSKVE